MLTVPTAQVAVGARNLIVRRARPDLRLNCDARYNTNLLAAHGYVALHPGGSSPLLVFERRKANRPTALQP